MDTPVDDSAAAVEKPHKHAPGLSPWHRTTIALLAVGYAGYYFCRSNLSVVLPQLIDDLARHGIARDQAQMRLGFIASAGIVAYALGKFLAGAIADVLGGRRNFLGGMVGSILFVVLFASGGGFPLFTVAWIGNRFMQSAGWSGLVKVSSRWFSYSVYGTVMAILSLSFLFGDAACRWIMGQLIGVGLGWRGVFYFSAAALGIIFVVNAILLRETPAQRGLPAPVANPVNIYAAEGEAENAHPGMAAILRPLLSSFAFWLVCLLSLGTTLLRETFNLWTPTYFVEAVGLTAAQAASRSALFPLFGGVAVLLAGVLSDRLGLNGRNFVIVFGMAASTLCLIGLGSVEPHANPWLPVVLVSLAGFLLLGPYSYLAGAISLDFGGMRGSATASGIIDGIGYLAGYLAGDSMARVTIAFGWNNAFRLLACAAFLTTLVAILLLYRQRATQPRSAVAAAH